MLCSWLVRRQSKQRKRKPLRHADDRDELLARKASDAGGHRRLGSRRARSPPADAAGRTRRRSARTGPSLGGLRPPDDGRRDVRSCR